jgi:hypothetical protein
VSGGHCGQRKQNKALAPGSQAIAVGPNQIISPVKMKLSASRALGEAGAASVHVLIVANGDLAAVVSWDCLA